MASTRRMMHGKRKRRLTPLNKPWDMGKQLMDRRDPGERPQNPDNNIGNINNPLNTSNLSKDRQLSVQHNVSSTSMRAASMIM